MNAMASECSSGCESGWTLYLEHSLLSQNVSHKDTPFIGGNDGFYEEKDKRAREEQDSKEEEEDLSMVSDASSGPPHFLDDEAYFNEYNGCFHSESEAAAKMAKTAKKKQKVKENVPCGDQNLPSFLDDTASSPVFDFATNNGAQASTESVLDYSQGFSATYFEERSSIQDHYASYNHLYQKMNFRTANK